jgi:hypothetical protein
VAAERLYLVFRHSRYIMPLKYNVSGTWTIQPKNAAARSRLTAPAFSYQAERLILLYLKTNIIYGLYVTNLVAQ